MLGNSDYVLRDNIIVQNSLCNNLSTLSSNYLIIFFESITWGWVAPCYPKLVLRYQKASMSTTWPRTSKPSHKNRKEHTR